MLIGSRTMMLDCYSFPVKEVFSSPENTDSRAWYLLLPAAEQKTPTRTHTHISSILKLLTYNSLTFMSVCVLCAVDMKYFIWRFYLWPTYFLSNYDYTVINTIDVNLLGNTFHNKGIDSTNNNTQNVYLLKWILWHNKCWLLTAFWWLHFSLSITC